MRDEEKKLVWVFCSLGVAAIVIMLAVVSVGVLTEPQSSPPESHVLRVSNGTHGAMVEYVWNPSWETNELLNLTVYPLPYVTDEAGRVLP